MDIYIYISRHILFLYIYIDVYGPCNGARLIGLAIIIIIKIILIVIKRYLNKIKAYLCFFCIHYITNL